MFKKKPTGRKQPCFVFVLHTTTGTYPLACSMSHWDVAAAGRMYWRGERRHAEGGGLVQRAQCARLLELGSLLRESGILCDKDGWEREALLSPFTGRCCCCAAADRDGLVGRMLPLQRAAAAAAVARRCNNKHRSDNIPFGRANAKLVFALERRRQVNSHSLSAPDGLLFGG